MTTYYHGTTGIIEDITATTDICLTTDSEAAEAYLLGSTGTIYTVGGVDVLSLADEDTVMEIAAELAGCDASDRIAMDAAGYGYAFEAADSRRVQAALVEAGYHGCSYGDMTPDNAMEHDCIRIFDAALLVITGTIED